MKAKRVVALFFILILMFSLLALRITQLSNPSGELSMAAAEHGGYDITIDQTRGTIYDSSLKPLVNDAPEYYAVVSPSKDTPKQLASLSPYVSDLKTLEQKLSSRLPFVIKVNSSEAGGPDVRIITGVKRYDDNMAPQLIGYLDGDGNGAAGIEKACDSQLKAYSQTLTAAFPVDASGHELQGLSPKISTTGSGDAGGVVLTLDRDIQQAAQRAADKYFKAGAVVVMDPKTGDILACVSSPDFSPNDLADALKQTDSPMLNRAFSAYNLGSVFKIVMVAAALEQGILPDYTYTCTGGINVSGRIFGCDATHGAEDMSEGFANSCNAYFINLGQKIGGENVYNMVKALGLGTSNSFAQGFGSSAGVLPARDQLGIPAALANLSIGEGDLMTTPVQIARIVSTVVNGGLEPAPRLVKELVDNDKNVTKTYAAAQTERVFSGNTAEYLRQFMIKTVNDGTGTAAQPTYGGAGGKTGTAQTGIVADGKTIDQAWFAGFYPAEEPKYVIVAMKENGTSGGVNAGPVFKYIADYLASRCGYPTVVQ